MQALFYSPDSYGLGHVRRSISLAKAVLGEFPDSRARVLTGAPRAHYFAYPDRCDYIRLPPITKNTAGRYVPRDHDSCLEDTVRLRRRLIRQTVASFRPDVMLVDHNPLGLCGEVLPSLRRTNALRILGLRDIIDEPSAVRANWERNGIIDVLRECYDLILVYGQRHLFDPVRAYGIPDDVARKMKFVGYIPRNGREADPDDLRTRLAPRTGKMVLVTLGGGGDGDVLLRRFCRGYELLGSEPPFEVAAVTGPLMSPDKRRRFRAWADRLPGLTLLEYTPEMPDLIEASSFVVSMGGYNTVCEMACAGARAAIVPRSFPRKEQLVRARVLADRGVVICLPPDEATPEKLVETVLHGLESDRPSRGWGLGFTGLNKAARALRRLAGRSPNCGPDSRCRTDAVA